MKLNGALLLARLLKMAAEDLEILLSSIYAWSDSTIVLLWVGYPISAPSGKFMSQTESG